MAKALCLVLALALVVSWIGFWNTQKLYSSELVHATEEVNTLRSNLVDCTMELQKR